MRLSSVLNLVCVAIIAGQIGARIQKKKDTHDIEEALNEFAETLKQEFSKKGTSKNWSDIILESRKDAETVLEHLDSLVSDYGVVTVADLKDMVGLTSTFKDNQLGWTNIRNSTIKRVRFGYVLDLPQTKPIG